MIRDRLIASGQLIEAGAYVQPSASVTLGVAVLEIGAKGRRAAAIAIEQWTARGRPSWEPHLDEADEAAHRARRERRAA